ncbi:MAG TPA: ACP S-malonyltransferase, partial [Acidimicrobiia bacterium]|nr:ACP S-malonyltransferase [Acidimicrobiia bacterium]
MSGVGILFPGQGSQSVGMGADLFEARPDLLGARADQVLGFSLRTLCLDGPEEELTGTEHAQPALFALSYALWDMVESEGVPVPAGAAGHSLGEYTALTAAGVFDYDTALALVARRGRAMGAAAGVEDSGMAALLGADPEVAEEVTRRRRDEGGRLEVANVNAPGQVVVAGGKDDIDWLAENGGKFGIRRVIRLPVAGAFHSGFM